ncbi:MAG: hypothetical protein FWF22_03245 [Treponema sp.]|nr:hypothetical protein [Treponema sp.]
MLLVTEYCAKFLKSCQWNNPMELFDCIFPEILAYAKKTSGRSDLKPTFVLNAMVPVDNAVWQLYAMENGIHDFDSLIPKNCSIAFIAHHSNLAAIPLITYGTTLDQIGELADAGYSIFKIKIGSDPDSDGDLRKTLAWDKSRIKDIHSILKNRTTAFTATGTVAYYLDANGRYKTLEQIHELLDFIDSIGALDQVVLFEEPFPYGSSIDVSGLPVTVAADESAYSDTVVESLIELGYRAIALKPIAKTMSMSFKIASMAAKKGIPCFCADLTVDPLLVDYNKCFAARLEAIPGMKIGILESNGQQNYAEWNRMLNEHPIPDGEWINVHNGVFNLNEKFYSSSGGIFNARG